MARSLQVCLPPTVQPVLALEVSFRALSSTTGTADIDYIVVDNPN